MTKKRKTVGFEHKRGSMTEDFVLGERIRSRRLSLGITQQQLAEIVSVTYQQIQKYENGKNRVSGGRLVKIAAALKTDANTLIPSGVAPESVSREVEQFAGSVEGAAISQYFRVLDQPTRAAIVRLAKSLADSKTAK